MASKLHKKMRQQQKATDGGGWRSYALLLIAVLVALVAAGIFQLVSRAQQEPPAASVQDTQQRVPAVQSGKAGGSDALLPMDGTLVQTREGPGRRFEGSKKPQRRQRRKLKPRRLPPSAPEGGPDVCSDDVQACAMWAETGECKANPVYMQKNCRVSCGVCTLPEGAPRVPSKAWTAATCKDVHATCTTWAAIGECDTNPDFMKVQCPVTCRLCQSEECYDESDDCQARAALGCPAADVLAIVQPKTEPGKPCRDLPGCYSDPAMMDECAWTCLTCDLEEFGSCKRKRSHPPAATPGTGDAMFEKIASSTEFNVTVHSRDPWILTIDDFLDDGEAAALLDAPGIRSNFKRSMAGDGVLAARTSSTSWCSNSQCMTDVAIQKFTNKVEELTGVPQANAEYLQVLEYQQGQFYKTHHDQNSPRSSAWGPRLYTFFTYLSDDDTGLVGGQTRFPLLNITVTAKKGRALFWTSVMNSAPFERDDRTDHEALPVEAGVKYAANYWLHMYPFREASTRGCSNIAYADNWI